MAPLDTVHDLRDLFGLSAPDLSWFADPKSLERSAGDERLRHYRYRWSPKRGGGARLIEEPKQVLKHVQRVILREILGHVPPHPAARGFCAGRSAVTFAAAHTGRQVLLHLDLRDFFASIAAGRVFGIFRQCGYPEPVAHLLTALVTNAVPPAVWAEAPRPADPASLDAYRRLGRHLAHPHLPQGAPTSPALANLAAFALDRRLTSLAAAAGLTYARYADELALSSPSHHSAHQVAWLIGSVTGIAEDEGFHVNEPKTSVRRAGQRQRLAGVIVNGRPNIERREYERLKAILHNAGRSGAAAENREGHPCFRDHLRGRVAWVNHLNPQRGERLLAAFARVDWSDAGG